MSPFSWAYGLTRGGNVGVVSGACATPGIGFSVVGAEIVVISFYRMAPKFGIISMMTELCHCFRLASAFKMRRHCCCDVGAHLLSAAKTLPRDKAEARVSMLVKECDGAERIAD